MSPELAFGGLFLLTVVLLLATLITGRRGLLSWHLPLVAMTVIALALTIYAALKLGKHYDLPSAGLITPVHYLLARLATGSFLLPLLSGVALLHQRRHAREQTWRSWHRRAALLAFALTLLASVTGLAMLLMADKV